MTDIRFFLFRKGGFTTGGKLRNADGRTDATWIFTRMPPKLPSSKRRITQWLRPRETLLRGFLGRRRNCCAAGVNIVIENTPVIENTHCVQSVASLQV